jgi:hypothetical protein
MASSGSYDGVPASASVDLPRNLGSRCRMLSSAVGEHDRVGLHGVMSN